MQVTLDAPNGSFLFNMAWGDAVIVAPESIENIKTNPIGTGAFKFDNWVQGDRIDIVKNADYWGEPAKLDRATFKFISDPTAAFAAVMAEDVRCLRRLPRAREPAAVRGRSAFSGAGRHRPRVKRSCRPTTSRPPFDNIQVREAMAHAIDRQAIIDGAMFGYGTPIGTHFAPHNPDYVDLTAQFGL